MAITEFEPAGESTDLPVDIAPEIEKKPPLEVFKEGLQEMVSTIEGQGLSTLGSLLAIREELRDRRRILMTESLYLEQSLRESDYKVAKIIAALNINQEEQILVYHKLEWLEGYVRDRQN